MKGLTLHQPWATLMAMGAKRIETRGWSTDYRGPVAIHAGRTLSGRARMAALAIEFQEVLEPALRRSAPWAGGLPYTQLLTDVLPYGAVLAVARLAGCVQILPGQPPPPAHVAEAAFGHYAVGRFCWLFSDVQPLIEPVPLRGRQRLWDITEEDAWRVRQKLGD